MVASCSAAFSSMCGTILMAIGRHWSVRSTGVTSLHVGLGAHVLVLPSVGHILTVGCVPCIGYLGRLARPGLLSHTVRLDHASRPCMHQSHRSVMVHVGLLAARQDHSREVVAGRPSDGSIVVTSSLQHVRHYSHWLPLAAIGS